MSFDSQLVIELLNRDHNRTTLNCGNDPLNSYLKQQATQDIKRHVSRIFIARSPGNKTTILGYYTLSTLSIDLSDLPEKVARKLPKHPLPAALIGRLAVELSMQGHGVGQMLLANALKRTLAVAMKSVSTRWWWMPSAKKQNAITRNTGLLPSQKIAGACFYS